MSTSITFGTGGVEPTAGSLIAMDVGGQRLFADSPVIDASYCLDAPQGMPAGSHCGWIESLSIAAPSIFRRD